MYQDIIDELFLPFKASDVKNLLTEDNHFVVELKSGKKFKSFRLTESLRRSEFESICKMFADRLLNI